MSIVKELSSRMLIPAGQSAYELYCAKGGILTETEWLASLAQGIPKYAARVEDCMDQSSLYVLPDGYIYAYTYGERQTVAKAPVEDTDSNPYFDNTRITSGGGIEQGVYGYVTTPMIDLLSYQAPFTLHLEGADFLPANVEAYTKVATYRADQSKIAVVSAIAASMVSAFNVRAENVSVDSNGDATITFVETPKTNNGNQDGVLKYARFSGKGTVADARVYVTYTTTSAGYAWRNTGIRYTSQLTDQEKAEIAQLAAGIIDTQLLSVIGDGEIA